MLHKFTLWIKQLDKFKKLESLNIINDTLIMFMSDNGGCAEFLKEDTSTESWGRYNIPTVDGRKINIGNSPLIEPGSDDTFMPYDIAYNVSNTPFRLFKSWFMRRISTLLISWPNQIPKRNTALSYTFIDNGYYS